MRQYIVNAFTNQLFEGNPAAVCVMESWPDRQTMMNIAMQNNLSETAFVVLEGEEFQLRWFTPTEEVGLCGHATLAAAYVILNHYMTRASEVIFQTEAGPVPVSRMGNNFLMTFSAIPISETQLTEAYVEALGIAPKEIWSGLDTICVMESAEEVENCHPKMDLLKQLPGRMLHITARDRAYTCVSRSFGPKIGIPEDPVCGSAHCQIAPYWARKLNNNLVAARQASARGGKMMCMVEGGLVQIIGDARLYSVSELYLDL